MKYFYIVITVSENKKYYNYVIKANSSDNLLSKLKTKNIIAADIHETKKRAYQIAAERNAVYKLNNNYLFNETF